MVRGDRARLSASAMHARPVSRYHTPAAAIGRGRKRQEENTPSEKMICQRPGSIQRADGADRRAQASAVRLQQPRVEIVPRPCGSLRPPCRNACDGCALPSVHQSRQPTRWLSKSRCRDRSGCDLQDQAARWPALRLLRWQENQSQQGSPGHTHETPCCAPSAGVCC